MKSGYGAMPKEDCLHLLVYWIIDTLWVRTIPHKHSPNKLSGGQRNKIPDRIHVCESRSLA